MFTKHNLIIGNASASLYSTVKVLFVSLVLLLMMAASFLLPNGALAADAGALSSSSSEESASTPAPDSFGRDTPRDTVQGFISALSQNDYLLASNYLNLSKSDNPTTTVRQFKQALDAGGRFQPDLQINNTSTGNLTDQLPANQEFVGLIDVGEQRISLLLERVMTTQGEQYWQFSSETLSAVPEVVRNTEATLVSRYTFEALEDQKIFGYMLADIVAALIMVVSSFIFTYILVWLLYHLIKIAYPRVRGEAMPVPDKVILPLAVVIMALILSEVMVYAGVSVTLREPVNRFAEIASWLATTWLLLRVIDSIFTRAVNLSYRKNHTERVSILGLLRKVVKALLLIFAVIVIFGNLGFDLTTGIAALGVGGLALALGAQKTIENLVGSVVVVADSPVRIGDYCKFGTYEGTVIDIGIRSSRVRTLSRTVVTVPNGDFSSMQIENFTSRDMFQFYHKLYIKRTASIDEVFKMVTHLDEYIDEHDLTNQEWNQANILELRQDCYVVQLQAYINSSNIVEFYNKQNELFVDVLNQVAKYKVEHALPTQQLIVNQSELEHQTEGDTQSNNDNNNDNATTASSIKDSAVGDGSVGDSGTIASTINDDTNDKHDTKSSADEKIDLNKNSDRTSKNIKDNKISIKKQISAEAKRKRKKLNAIKERNRVLKKSKFKHVKRKLGFSMWNPH